MKSRTVTPYRTRCQLYSRQTRNTIEKLSEHVDTITKWSDFLKRENAWVRSILGPGGCFFESLDFYRIKHSLGMTSKMLPFPTRLETHSLTIQTTRLHHLPVGQLTLRRRQELLHVITSNMPQITQRLQVLGLRDLTNTTQTGQALSLPRSTVERLLNLMAFAETRIPAVNAYHHFRWSILRQVSATAITKDMEASTLEQMKAMEMKDKLFILKCEDDIINAIVACSEYVEFSAYVCKQIDKDVDMDMHEEWFQYYYDTVMQNFLKFTVVDIMSCLEHFEHSEEIKFV